MDYNGKHLKLYRNTSASIFIYHKHIKNYVSFSHRVSKRRKMGVFFFLSFEMMEKIYKNSTYVMNVISNKSHLRWIFPHEKYVKTLFISSDPPTNKKKKKFIFFLVVLFQFYVYKIIFLIERMGKLLL